MDLNLSKRKLSLLEQFWVFSRPREIRVTQTTMAHYKKMFISFGPKPTLTNKKLML